MINEEFRKKYEPAVDYFHSKAYIDDKGFYIKEQKASEGGAAIAKLFQLGSIATALVFSLALIGGSTEEEIGWALIISFALFILPALIVFRIASDYTDPKVRRFSQSELDKLLTDYEKATKFI